MRIWHRAATNESCLLRGHRTCFLSEESVPQGVLQRLAGLVLHFWYLDLESEAPRPESSTQFLALEVSNLWGLSTPPGWWTLWMNIFTRWPLVRASTRRTRS